LAPDAPLVGLIARFDSQKNHFGFIEAAAFVHAQQADVHFVLAGTGVDTSNTELVTAIAAKGLQAHMHLLGRRDDVPRLMASLIYGGGLALLVTVLLFGVTVNNSKSWLLLAPGVSLQPSETAKGAAHST
jgi:cell division protein FtsW (lipid II flippase)